MTLTQTVEISADRRLHLDWEVPREVTANRARVIVQFPVMEDVQLPKKLAVKKDGKIHITRKQLDKMLEKSPGLNKLSGILHTDMTIDEIRTERLAKHL